MKIPFIKRRQDTVVASNGRKLLYLLLGIPSLIGLIYIIIAVPPTQTLLLNPVNISVIYLTLFLLGLSIFCIISYILKSSKHGILATLFVLVFFWLRLNKLLHPIFSILLIALFLTLELLFTAKKDK